MPVAGEAEIEAAIVAAETAFQIMRRLPRFVRCRYTLFVLPRDSCAGAATRRSPRSPLEAGKTLIAAGRGEVIGGAIFGLNSDQRGFLEACWYASEEVPLDMDAGVFEYQTTTADGSPLDLTRADFAQLAAVRRRIGIARRFPIGPILAIAPFNFPLNLVLHKVAPALAVGNAVVLKPAPQTPLTSLLLADILREAGLPEGALSVVHCPVPLAERMVRDERFAMVTFTRLGQGRMVHQGHRRAQEGYP